jgi:predicted DNA-binding transcriptional regulator AlpA
MTNRQAQLSNRDNPRSISPACQVRSQCGGISDMTLYRWIHDDSLAFPKPFYINRRRFWFDDEIAFWLEAQTARATSAAVA